MKNIIKLITLLVFTISYSQIQPVNFYQQFNKVNEANETDSIQVLVRTIGNPDHNIMKYVSASDIGGGGNIGDVSATESGIVNNTPLQELGGVDKLINGVRIGVGNNFHRNSTVLGHNSLNTNLSGSNQNTAIGAFVLSSLTTGDNNVGVGVGTLNTTTTGIYNSAFGDNTLQNNTTGDRNVGNGTSLYWNSTGARNTGVGFNAGHGQTTGNYNTYVGASSGYDAGVGNYNVAIGYGAFAAAVVGYTSSGSTRNNNNNVFIGSRITIPDGINSVFAVDNKGNTATAYNNALLYGSFLDRFLRINGRFEVAPSTMPVADAGFTKKLVWNPTTGVVAETNDTGGVQQFVQITEGANTGWGLKYRADNPNFYGDIGNNAIDLSYNSSTSTTSGATGVLSVVSGGFGCTASNEFTTVGGGRLNTASGQMSVVSGGEGNIASGSYNSTISGGYYNTASGTGSTISGGYYNTASGTGSTISGGYYNTANSYGEWVGGMYGTIPSGQSATTWVTTNRLFNIGNGTTASARSDAFTILKNGLATLPSVTNALIESASGKAVATKEWVLSQSLPVITITPTDITRIKLSSDVVSNTVTRENVAGLSFPVEAGKTYKVKLFGAYQTVAATTGGSIGFILTDEGVGTIFGKVEMSIVHTMTAAPEIVIRAINDINTTAGSFATSTGVGTINTPEVINGDLIFECTTSGTFQVQWGSEIASSNATLLKNTILEVTEI